MRGAGLDRWAVSSAVSRKIVGADANDDNRALGRIRLP